MTQRREFAITSVFPTAKPILTLFAIAALTCVAYGQPAGFLEDFTGPTLDPAWTQGGDPAGHPASIAGTYDITDAHGQPGTNLNRSIGGTVSSFTHEVDVVLSPHLLTGSGGTLSDFKFKSIGTDGVLDVVYNSFGDLRVNHTDFNTGSSDHIAGGSPNNINIGYADGDALKLTVDYHDGTDTIDVTYSLNGAAPVSVYSGTGIDGQFGDVITNSVEALVFKFGDAVPDQTVAAIDGWSLSTDTPAVTCDFDGDIDCDISDLNAMLLEGPIADGITVVPGVNDQFDLVNDGEINLADQDAWLAEAASVDGLGSPYKLGDANLDGNVDGTDFLAWNNNKFSPTLLWDAGNFNGDSTADGADFLHWNTNKFTSSAAVPEPGWAAAILLGLISIIGRRRQ